jgi:hypothetical protein
MRQWEHGSLPEVDFFPPPLQRTDIFPSNNKSIKVSPFFSSFFACPYFLSKLQARTNLACGGAAVSLGGGTTSQRLVAEAVEDVVGLVGGSPEVLDPLADGGAGAAFGRGGF